MKPTREQALRKAVGETLDPSEEEWEDIEERFAEIIQVET